MLRALPRSVVVAAVVLGALSIAVVPPATVAAAESYQAEPVPPAAADTWSRAAAEASAPAPAVPQRVAPRSAARRVSSTPAVRRRAPSRVVHRESAQALADRRGAAALAALGYPVHQLGYDVVFRPYVGGMLGFTDERTHRVTLFVRRSHTDFQLRVSLAHEIGHVLDFTQSTRATHRDYLAARGLPAGTSWYGCMGCTDYATPAGDFAEVFALWLAGPGDFRSEVAPAPSAAQLADLARRFFQLPS